MGFARLRAIPFFTESVNQILKINQPNTLFGWEVTTHKTHRDHLKALLKRKNCFQFGVSARSVGGVAHDNKNKEEARIS